MKDSLISFQLAVGLSPTGLGPSFSPKARDNVERIMKYVTPFPRVASPDRIPQLDFSERLFLWGFRSMVKYQWRGRPILAAIRQVYDQFNVEDAVASLDGLIEAFACTALAD